MRATDELITFLIYVQALRLLREQNRESGCERREMAARISRHRSSKRTKQKVLMARWRCEKFKLTASLTSITRTFQNEPKVILLTNTIVTIISKMLKKIMLQYFYKHKILIFLMNYCKKRFKIVVLNKMSTFTKEKLFRIFTFFYDLMIFILN